jgi:hypothetical protein
MINAKVTGYWGAGIPIDKGRVIANHKDGYVTIKWGDGREVMHLEHNIRDGAWHNHDAKKYGLSPIGIYWGAHLN